MNMALRVASAFFAAFALIIGIIVSEQQLVLGIVLGSAALLLYGFFMQKLKAGWFPSTAAPMFLFASFLYIVFSQAEVI